MQNGDLFDLSGQSRSILKGCLVLRLVALRLVHVHWFVLFGTFARCRLLIGCCKEPAFRGQSSGSPHVWCRPFSRSCLFSFVVRRRYRFTQSAPRGSCSCFPAKVPRRISKRVYILPHIALWGIRLKKVDIRIRRGRERRSGESASRLRVEVPGEGMGCGVMSAVLRE